MYGADNFANDSGVSSETLALYARWQSLLIKWNQSINLVQSNSIDDFWFRHARDSEQLTRFISPDTRSVIDLGSGAGFPGISLAIALKYRADAQVTLVESVGKKTSFLRAVIRELGLPAIALSDRAETLPARPYDLISARAFAPLPKLLGYAHRFWGRGTVAVLPKGQSADVEIEAARESYDFSLETKPSITDPDSKILLITDLKRPAKCAS